MVCPIICSQALAGATPEEVLDKYAVTLQLLQYSMDANLPTTSPPDYLPTLLSPKQNRDEMMYTCPIPPAPICSRI